MELPAFTKHGLLITVKRCIVPKLGAETEARQMMVFIRFMAQIFYPFNRMSPGERMGFDAQATMQPLDDFLRKVRTQHVTASYHSCLSSR